MDRQQFRPVGALGIQIQLDRRPRATLRLPWAGLGCPVGAQKCCLVGAHVKAQSGTLTLTLSRRGRGNWKFRHPDTQHTLIPRHHGTKNAMQLNDRQIREITHSNRSTTLGRFKGPKPESEITVKKLGHLDRVFSRSARRLFHIETRDLSGGVRAKRFSRSSRDRGDEFFQRLVIRSGIPRLCERWRVKERADIARPSWSEGFVGDRRQTSRIELSRRLWQAVDSGGSQHEFKKDRDLPHRKLCAGGMDLIVAVRIRSFPHEKSAKVFIPSPRWATVPTIADATVEEPAVRLTELVFPRPGGPSLTRPFSKGSEKRA